MVFDLVRRLGLVCRVVRVESDTAEGWEPPTRPSALEELLGHTTLRELDALIDHWAIAVVLQQHAWNVTHAAARLGVPRRYLRIRWARVRDRQTEALAGGEVRRSSPPPDLPAPPSLAGMLADGVGLVDLRRTARRWLVAATSELVGRNRTHTARILGTTRRRVREDIARHAAERELGSGG